MGFRLEIRIYDRMLFLHMLQNIYGLSSGIFNVAPKYV